MDNDKNENFESKIYFNKYKPEKKIGEGSFGKIYSCININTNEKFAIKMELKSSGQNLLESEACILCYLKGTGIPYAKSYGFSGNYNVLVMELLGKSLEDLFQQNGCKFSLKTVCMIAIHMLDRIEFIHSKHIIHRDIKPDNFVIGIDQNSSMIYLIDFGLAKKYRSSKTLEHNPIKNNKKLTGTARYASINALRGIEQSRRDDLEAIGYVVMYFLKGILPWQGLKVNKDEDRYRIIYEKKKNTKPEELCAGFPDEFTTYINYTRNLRYEQDPDYEYLRGLFKIVLTTYKLENDNKYDWIKSNEKNYNSSFSTLHPNNIVLNNLQLNNQHFESHDISLEKNNLVSPTINNTQKIVNSNTNIIITTNKNKDIQISHENANNLKINIVSAPSNHGNLNENENQKKYIISNVNTPANNNPNNSNLPVRYDNFVVNTLHNKQNINTIINNSINPQENVTNKNLESPEGKKKDKKARCCFS